MPFMPSSHPIHRSAQIDNLVLGTVNASWKRSIDAETLAQLIGAGQVGDFLPHVATFFGEVRQELILAFADAHGVSAVALRQTYEAVRAATGETNAALEAAIIVCITPQ